MNTSSAPAEDDTAGAFFLGTLGQMIGAGVYTSGPNTSQQCLVGVELIGAVTPTNYGGPITLRRKFPLVSPGELYINNNMPQGLFTNGSRHPGDDDTSLPQLLVTQPTLQNKVYDIDAPGTGLADDSVPYRIRYNFIEYAVLGNSPSGSTVVGPQVSMDFLWWVAVSCTQDSNFNLKLDTVIAGDNQAGQGQTKITADLK